MNGNTVFIYDDTILLSDPTAIYNTVGNIWKVELGEHESVYLEAPDVVGKKCYNIVVDDVYLLYERDNNKLMWSITWSTY